uniref:Putative lectin/glucanase superfamily protein n=1 Tax=viral metagenome TaxID=1070528 RepID=A0A6H1ZGG9_9ZZZZ
MSENRRILQAGALFSEDCSSLQDLRNRGTITSAPTIGRGPRGNYLAGDGTDDKVAFPGRWTVKTVCFWGWANSVAEQFIDFDGGTHYVDVAAGVVRGQGFTSPTVYVNGAAATALAAQTWAHIAVTTATGFTASALKFLTDNSAYGNVRIREVVLFDRALSAAEVLSIANDSWARFDRVCTHRYDMSEIDPQDLTVTAAAVNGTGTNIAAADIVAGPFGGYATDYDGTNEKTTMGNVGTVRTVSMLVYPATTTEELVLLSTGNDIMVSGGTVTYAGVTASATYVDGVATTTMVAGKWQHLVCVLSADHAAAAFAVATDGTNFGAVKVADVRTYSSALTNLQAMDLYARLRGGRA